MKHFPKIALGIIAIILSVILVASFYIFKKSQTPSYLNLFLQKNHFRIDFKIAQEDKVNFEKFLENLGVNTQLEQGINFTLDATSSAHLAFETPAKAKLEIKEKELKFNAVFNKNFQFENQKIEVINIPQKTTLAIYGPNLSGLVLKRLNLPQKIQQDFETNLGFDGSQYLLVNRDGTFALFYKKDSLDLKNFTQIPIESSKEAKPSHVLEAQTVYAYNQVQSFNSQEQPQIDLVLFNFKGYQILASNQQTAKNIIESESSNRQFPNIGNKKASMVTEFENSEDQALSEDFFKFLLGNGISNIINQQKLQDSLQKINSLNLLLYDNVISGLINLK